MLNNGPEICLARGHAQAQALANYRPRRSGVFGSGGGAAGAARRTGALPGTGVRTPLSPHRRAGGRTARVRGRAPGPLAGVAGLDRRRLSSPGPRPRDRLARLATPRPAEVAGQQRALLSAPADQRASQSGQATCSGKISKHAAPTLRARELPAALAKQERAGAPARTRATSASPTRSPCWGSCGGRRKRSDHDLRRGAGCHRAGDPAAGGARRVPRVGARAAVPARPHLFHRCGPDEPTHQPTKSSAWPPARRRDFRTALRTALEKRLVLNIETCRE